MDIGAERRLSARGKLRPTLRATTGCDAGQQDAGWCTGSVAGDIRVSGRWRVRIPITDSFMILIEIDVVAINVPLLLGLDFSTGTTCT